MTTDSRGGAQAQADDASPSVEVERASTPFKYARIGPRRPLKMPLPPAPEADQ